MFYTNVLLVVLCDRNRVKRHATCSLACSRFRDSSKSEPEKTSAKDAGGFHRPYYLKAWNRPPTAKFSHRGGVSHKLN